MICRTRLNKSGFTLIEIIITVVIVAILGAMILTFLSKSLVDSSEPVRRLRQSSYLNNIMANITADYYRYPKWRRGTVYSGNSFVVPTIRNGRCYTTSSGGTSGLTEPNWPPPGMDNNITWTDAGAITTLSSLKTSIGPENTDQNNGYGSYHVERNRYILFISDSEADDTVGYNKILKVGIKNNQGEILTALFISH